ncbi:hypothetical protein ABK040_008877 [Willaertia magna]
MENQQTNVYIEQEEPTEEDVIQYAKWLGLDPVEDSDLMHIALEGIKAPLPEGWRPCQTEEGQLFYFNFNTGDSIWDHPMDAYYKQKAKEEKMKKEKEKKKKKKTVKKKIGKLEPIAKTSLDMHHSDNSLLLPKTKSLKSVSSMGSASSSSVESSPNSNGSNNERNFSPPSSITSPEVDRLQLKIESLEQNLDAMRQERNELQKTIANLTEDIQKSNDNLKDQKTKIENELKNKYEALLSTKDEEMRKRIDDIKLEMENHSAKYLQTISDLENVNKNITEQKIRIEKENRILMEKEINSKESEIKKVYEDIISRLQKEKAEELERRKREIKIKCDNSTQTNRDDKRSISSQTDPKTIITTMVQTDTISCKSIGVTALIENERKEVYIQTISQQAVQEEKQQQTTPPPPKKNTVQQTIQLITRETEIQTENPLPSILKVPYGVSPIKKIFSPTKTPLRARIQESNGDVTFSVKTPEFTTNDKENIKNDYHDKKISKLHPEFKEFKNKIEKKIEDERMRLKKAKEFCRQEKENIRTRQTTLEQARTEWKSDVINSSTLDDSSQYYSNKILKTVKQHLETQAHSLNSDIKRINQIQKYIKLRKEKVKILEQSLANQEKELISVSHSGEFTTSPSSSSSSGEDPIIPNKHFEQILNRIEEEIALIHKKIEGQTHQQVEDNYKIYHTSFPTIEESATNLNMTQDYMNLSLKWRKFFGKVEKRRLYLQTKLNDFQKELNKWMFERDQKRDLFVRHGNWLKSLKNEF